MEGDREVVVVMQFYAPGSVDRYVNAVPNLEAMYIWIALISIMFTAEPVPAISSLSLPLPFLATASICRATRFAIFFQA